MVHACIAQVGMVNIPPPCGDPVATVCAGEESRAHRGRGEEAAQALRAAHQALEVARTELAGLQAAAEAAAPHWEERLAGLRADLDAAQAARDQHKARPHGC